MGNIGTTPPSLSTNPDAMGQLGLPIWLWVTDRNENTVGPNDKEAEAGNLRVVVSARLDRTEWRVSRDGQDVAMTTCRGTNAGGTPYDGRDPELPPPCGFPAGFNTNVGTLTITATAHWVVNWTATNGEQGTIPVTPPSSTTQIRIGETQAILD
ncbi:hypothetical protein [Myceligenerans crystallogenes]